MHLIFICTYYFHKRVYTHYLYIFNLVNLENYINRVITIFIMHGRIAREDIKTENEFNLNTLHRIE